MVCRWAREIDAEPRFLSPALAQAFLQTEQPTLTPDLPRDISCLRLLLPKGTLFSEEGPEIRSVVVAEVRAMEGWLPDNVQSAGGGLSCVGLGEDGATYLASSLLDPSARVAVGCRWCTRHCRSDGATVRPCALGATVRARAGERG